MNTSSFLASTRRIRIASSSPSKPQTQQHSFIQPRQLFKAPLYRSVVIIPPSSFCGAQRTLHLSTHASSVTRTCSRSLSTSRIIMAANGDVRKRRKSPVHASERPLKHFKVDTNAPTPGDATPQNGTVYSIESDLGTPTIMNPLSAATTDSPEWQATIENVIKSVVSIHFCQTCSFDTDLSMSSQATGFVVDAERGYIMTNRHVVCAGPFWGYCLFENHEEVRVARPVISRS
jgi:hypothetical protein